MQETNTYQRGLVGWLSLAQLISWGSIFYTFALIMGPVESELALTRVEVSLAFSLALLVEGVLAYPVGRWIEQGHKRVVMTSGSLLAGLCLAALHVLVCARGVWAWLVGTADCCKCGCGGLGLGTAASLNVDEGACLR